MKPPVRNGLLFGAIAAVATFVVNLANGAMMNGDTCHRQGTPLPVLGFIIFVILAGAAGRQTSIGGGSAAVAGLLTGAVSGLATVLLVLLSLNRASQVAAQCLQGANTQGINVGAVASGFGLVLALVVYLIGLGVGAGAGTLGSAIAGPRRPAV